MKTARTQRPPKPVVIPQFVIDFFLTERGRPASVERFTQDGGVVSDVWYEFGRDLAQPVRVLIAPTEGVSPVEIGAILYSGIREYRNSEAAQDSAGIRLRRPVSVSPLETFVAVTLYLDELLRVILPLTRWWSLAGLGLLNAAPLEDKADLQKVLRDEICSLLGHERQISTSRTRGNRAESGVENRARTEREIRESASIAALVGLFVLAAGNSRILKDIPPNDPSELRDWMWDHADEIAEAAVTELTRPIHPSIFSPKLSPASEQAARANDPDGLNPPALIHRVFRDRQTSLAVEEGICTVKADAANRVFDISCRNITWGIIDSGIDPTHPAFESHDPKRPGKTRVTRIRAILDFTQIEQIRNFGLTESDNESLINNIIKELKDLPDYPFLAEPEFEKTARQNLNAIAEQLRQRLQPDWALIEPLIRRRGQNDGEPEPLFKVASGHGTHVAGILGADWRSEDSTTPEKNKVILGGICPDINLYDLRVIDRHNPNDPEGTESAVLAALEYVQFANRRTLGMKQVIHGVNISLSIPHVVRSYACGSTPVCVACNNLVGSGVVVVAAAGNRGWAEQEIGFGNFVFCSITDPGNAEEVITVGATHRERPHTYGVSFFSSRGPTGDGRVKPDLVAPGEKINGPIPDQSSDQFDGTSMAAPFVSGAAAMLIARNSELVGNPRRIKQILRDSATDLGREKYFQGYGLVDVLRALQLV